MRECPPARHRTGVPRVVCPPPESRRFGVPAPQWRRLASAGGAEALDADVFDGHAELHEQFARRVGKAG